MQTTCNLFNEFDYEFIKGNDYVAAARYLLTREINSKLSKNKVRFRLLWDRKRQDSKPHAVAVNLLGAMYYQFYDAVRSGRHFKKCVVCGKWERVERSTWLYHDSCGSTWRNRKRRVLEAVRKGKKTTAQLAVELGVDAATVEAWIK